MVVTESEVDVKYNVTVLCRVNIIDFIENEVNNIVVTMYGAKWVLEISWGSLVKVNDCVNSMLYT